MNKIKKSVFILIISKYIVIWHLKVIILIVLINNTNILIKLNVFISHNMFLLILYILNMNLLRENILKVLD